MPGRFFLKEMVAGTGDDRQCALGDAFRQIGIRGTAALHSAGERLE
jgi:hypothetical protein